MEEIGKKSRYALPHACDMVAWLNQSLATVKLSPASGMLKTMFSKSSLFTSNSLRSIVSFAPKVSSS